MRADADGPGPELLQRCLDGEPGAWDLLVESSYPRILEQMRFLTKDDEQAQDLTQDLFLKLLRNDGKALRSYDASFGVSVHQYLRVIATRLFLGGTKSWRQKLKSNCIDLSEVAEILDSGAETDSYVISRELEDVISSLPVRQRTAIRMKVDGLSYEEISRMLGIGIGGVGALLHRAREALTRCIEPPPPKGDQS